jgi:hypothetical protein
MHKPVAEFVTDEYPAVVSICNFQIPALRPLQNNVWPVLPVKSKESPVQFYTFGFQNTQLNFHARVHQFFDALPFTSGKGSLQPITTFEFHLQG